jgi:hypothetical protein
MNTHRLFAAALLFAPVAASSPPLASPSPAALSSSLSSSSSSSFSPLPPLPGLLPGAYLKKRNHDPDITADLQALPAARRVDVALALLAAPASALPLAPAADYPAGLSEKARSRLRQLEVRAARTGALVVLGGAEDARARAALVKAIDDADDHVAAVAAERLGSQRDDAVVDVLARVAADDHRTVDVRAGACAGLGRHREDSAERALAALLSTASDKAAPPPVAVAALHAVANLGSSWAWQASGDVARGAALRAQARVALSALSVDGDVAAARDSVLLRLR